tara:strand:- start:3711 stop:4409 length:699 start_codon:yes stop_codon:yes gene_type:complete
MSIFRLNKKMARLIVLQRIELLGPFQKRIRKLFGRYLFGNFFSKFIFNTEKVGTLYFDIMNKEFESINNSIDLKNQKILSIGGGMGGLEAQINLKFKDNRFYFIEKNYVSKKVKYGWDPENNEGYNNLNLLKDFLILNGMKEADFKIYDQDKDELPNVEFDIITSLYSLDYHYDFNIYIDYIKKNSNKNTKIIFDTIRPEFFSNIFKNIKVLKINDETIHKSKRLLCSEFIK